MESRARIDIGTEVKSSDGKHVGDIDWLVIDGRTNQVAYLVIDKKVYSNGRLVAIEQVAGSDDRGVVLSITADEVKRLPIYDEVETIQFRGPMAFGDPMGGVTSTTGSGEHWVIYGPQGGQYAHTGEAPFFRTAPIGGVVANVVTSIPESDIAISEGTSVVDSQGDTIGRVDEVLLDNENKISGLIVRTGRVRHHSMRIDQEWIAGIAHDHIRLNVTRDQVKQKGRSEEKS